MTKHPTSYVHNQKDKRTDEQTLHLFDKFQKCCSQLDPDIQVCGGVVEVVDEVVFKGSYPSMHLLMGIGRQKNIQVKLMAVAGDLSKENTHQALKYPKTPHLPFSPGIINHY